MLIFNVSIDEPHPVICLELKKETNYTVELMSVSYSQYPAQINILSTISGTVPNWCFTVKRTRNIYTVFSFLRCERENIRYILQASTKSMISVFLYEHYSFQETPLTADFNQPTFSCADVLVCISLFWWF